MHAGVRICSSGTDHCCGGGGCFRVIPVSTLRESLTDAIRYWEPRRILYNAVLAATVLTYFGLNYPASKESLLSVNGALFIFILAVLANVAYCSAYLADIFA